MFVARYDRTMRNARPVADAGIDLKRPAHSVQFERAKAKQLLALIPRPAPAKPKRAVMPPKPKLVKPVARFTPQVVWSDFRIWLRTAETSHRAVSEIIEYMAARYAVFPSDIKGARRFRLIVAVRQAAMAMAYVECIDLSLVQIGKCFGGKDHTTVFHSIRKAGVWRNPGKPWTARPHQERKP